MSKHPLMRTVVALAALTACLYALRASTGTEVSILSLVLLGLCFLPALIADARRHHQRTAITVLNILSGIVFLFIPLLPVVMWIVALVWACTYTPGIAAMQKSV